MKLSLLSVNEIPPLDQIWSYPFVVLSRCWDGSESPVTASFLLLTSPNSLCFAVRGKHSPWVFTERESGEFVEGLWERDVVELFFSPSFGARDSYTEVNLAPNGAYWVSSFSEYRKRDAETPRIKAFFSSNTGAEWRVAITLDGALSSGDQVNVCGILGREKRHFLTWNAPTQEVPDFHLASLRRDVEVIASS